MTVSAIVDAGPLVAALDRSDTHHRWAREQLGTLARPLLVCEPVLAEAAHLLRRQFDTSDDLFELLDRRLLDLTFSLRDHQASVRALMRRYRDVPMSLADGCVVRMAELHASHHVCTLDGDFSIYRKNGRQVIRVISPHG